MSGHSKWATTKHRKAAQDKKRSALFSKLSRMITVAAKTGGDPNPENNASLAAAIAKAKSYSLPKDKIETAIAKAFGAGDCRGLRRGRLRGLRTRRRRHLYRGAHRQPQPYGRRCPQRIRPCGRQSRRDGFGRFPVRAQRRRSRSRLRRRPTKRSSSCLSRMPVERTSSRARTSGSSHGPQRGDVA
jgi:hypothetical protein